MDMQNFTQTVPSLVAVNNQCYQLHHCATHAPEFLGLIFINHITVINSQTLPFNPKPNIVIRAQVIRMLVQQQMLYTLCTLT